MRELVLDCSDSAQNFFSTSKMARIEAEDWVFLKLPSGNIKLTQLKKESEIIDLGKFGTFDSKHLIGQFFGISLQINEDGLSRYEKPVTTFNDNGNNNQFLNDDQTTQQLTQKDIEQMKSENKNNIIDEIIKNNKQFASKTSFSQQKYIKRKISKFSKHFIPMRVNILNLLDFYKEKNWDKIMELRIDSLSQILTYSNVNHASRLLVCDNTNGLLGNALLERITTGTIYFIYDGPSPNLDLLKYGKNVNYHCYPWFRFDTPIVYQAPKTGDTEKSKQRYELATSEHQELHRGEFDGLIIASKFDPVQVIKKLSPFLKGSGIIVCYSPQKEVLLFHLDYFASI